MLIFGALIVTESIGGFGAAAFGAVILLVMLTEMWGRYGSRGEVDHE
jgi:hypothetical protein